MQKGRRHKKQQKVRKPRSKSSQNNSSTIEVSTEDSPISSYLLRLQSLSREIKQSGVQHVNSNPLKKKIKDSVKIYFQNIRVDFIQNGLDTNILDEKMQTLLSYANARMKVSLYNSLLSSILGIFQTFESQQLIAKSNQLVEAKNVSGGVVLIGLDKKIIDVLSRIIPSIALSYEQVLVDISQSRLSYKGTAAELREVLREILDYLAPDSEVLSSPGFKLEKDRTTPTMKQKVRFILKNRKKSQSAIEVPENATEIVEESIAKLVRATYNRGSLSTHAATERSEIVNIKRYLDSLLCELLEIH